jgi:hypothetical protein
MPPASPSPASSKALLNALTDAFNLEELQQLVYQTLGRPLRNLVDEHADFTTVVFTLLDKTYRDGVSAVFLRAVLLSKPARSDLRPIIAQVCPEALQLPAESKAEVLVIDQAVREVHGQLDDPRVRQQVAESRGKLTLVANQIDQLERYKNLHECLHKILFQFYHQVADAARRFKTDPLASDTLADYATQIGDQARTARTVINGLPTGPTSQGLELAWVGQLETAVGEFGKARQDLNEAPAADGVRRLKRILGFDPIRINASLTKIAGDLPLPLLADTLDKAAQAADGKPGAKPIRAGHQALQALYPQLTVRVAEHTSWQQVENDLWHAEDNLYQKTPDAREEFLFLWPSIKAAIAALAALDQPTADWVVQLNHFAPLVDAALATGPAEAAAPDPTRLAFKDYRRAAMLRFFAVDDGLRKLCTEIVALSDSINNLLHEVPHVV